MTWDRHIRNDLVSIDEMRTFLRGSRFAGFSVWLTSKGRGHDKKQQGSLVIEELAAAALDWLKTSGSPNPLTITKNKTKEEQKMDLERDKKRAKAKEDLEMDHTYGGEDKAIGEKAMSKTLVLLNELEIIFMKGGRAGAGGLEVDEFIAAYSKLGIDDPNYFEEMFQKIDVNNDGVLEWREFINFMLYSNMAQLSMHENDHSQEYIPKKLPMMNFHRNNTVMQLQRLRYIEKEGVLVSTSKEGSFRIWSESNLALQKTVQVGNFCVTDVVAAEWLSMLVCCSIEGTISFYRFDNLNMRMHRESISSVPLCATAWCEGGSLAGASQHVAVGADCGGIHIWKYSNSDRLTERTDKYYKIHTNWVTQLMFVPSLQYLVSSSQDSKISLYNIASGQEVKSYTAHLYGVNAFAYSAMYRTMFSVGAERAVYVWNVIGCSTVTKMLGHTAPIISVTIRENYNQLVTQASDHVIRIWDAQLYHNVQSIDCDLLGLQGHYPLALVTAHPNSSSLIVCTHCPFEWPMRQDDPEGQKITSHDHPLIGVVFVAQWKQIVTVSIDYVVNVWDLRTGMISLKFLIDPQSYSKIVSVGIDNTCRRLITGHQDGVVCMWNTSNGECLSETACGKMPVTSLAYVYSTEDGVGYMWAGGTSECIHGFRDIVPAQPHTRSNDKIRNHPGDIMCMTALSSEYFATGCNKGIINIWNARGTIHCMCKLPKQTDRPVTAKSTVSTYSERTKHSLVHQLRRGKRLSELNADSDADEDLDNYVYTIEKVVSLLHHGHIFVSCGSDGMLKFWDYARCDKQMGTLLFEVATGYDEADNISQLATNAVQDRLVTSNEDGLVKIWSIAKLGATSEEGTPLAEVTELVSWRSHSLTLMKVINGGESDLVVTTGHDMTVAVWTIEGAKIGVFGQWTLWDYQDVSTFMEPNPRIALALKKQSSAEITTIAFGEPDKKDSIEVRRGSQTRRLSRKHSDPTVPHPPSRESKGKPRFRSEHRRSRESNHSRDGQTNIGLKLPHVDGAEKAPRKKRRDKGSNEEQEKHEEKDQDELDDLALLESLRPKPPRQFAEVTTDVQNKEIVDRFLQMKTERARNHMNEIARSRYTTNYLWHVGSGEASKIHSLDKAVTDEFGPSGYLEEKKRGRKPFITGKREREIKALRDIVDKAGGSSRRPGGLLVLQQDIAKKMAVIGRESDDASARRGNYTARF